MEDRFVLITTQRTGATFFRSCLESHPDIECPGTLFAQKVRFKYFSVDWRKSYYREYRSRTLRNRIAHWSDRRKAVHGCLDEAYGATGGAKVLGFKISYSNFERYPSIAEWLTQNDIKVIHWFRRNLVKRHVSALTKQARGKAHFTRQVERVKVHVDVGELLRDLKRKTHLIGKYRAMFQGKEHIEVYYEDFLAQQESEARRILDFLGVNPDTPLSTGLVKQNPDRLQEIIENYDQVWAALEGTDFQHYLTTS
jgi:LPS sulfotransferase NodH